MPSKKIISIAISALLFANQSFAQKAPDAGASAAKSEAFGGLSEGQIMASVATVAVIAAVVSGSGGSSSSTTATTTTATATTNSLSYPTPTSQSSLALGTTNPSTDSRAVANPPGTPVQAVPENITIPPTPTKTKNKNVWIYDREYTRSAWTYNPDSPGYGDLGVRKSIEKTIQQMDRVAALLKSHNIKLSVGVYPWPAQLMYDQENSLQVQLWKKFCEQQHCENFYNAFPAFFNAVRTSGMDATIYQYYFQGDMHFAKEGNALVADTILRDLKKSP
jgi:hypothetical protein